MDRISSVDRYWYIYEADDIDLESDFWAMTSTTGIDWDKTPPDRREENLEMIRTGWDGTGDWYKRDQDVGSRGGRYPLIQVVKHKETHQQHLVSLVPLPGRGEPKWLFYLSYMPFFLEPAERDERYLEAEEAS